jgi:NAD(P)-dependent dehydrogenase (short-subunit alcohol dehydrogenase family)
MPGPVVFITGAGRGVGRALALRFAQDGYHVAASGRSEGPLGSLVREIADTGGTAAPFACDVTDRRSVAAAVSSTESTLGPIDVLVNNAGAAASAPFVSMDDQLWDEMISVNLTGTYLCMRAVLPGMFERRRGRVINIASTAGKTGFMYTSAYCAAKHAVVGLTRSVALEAAKRGVTVNAICPGWLNTDMTNDSIARIVAKTGRTHDEARGMLEQMNPQGRLIEPDEVAALAAFLASADAIGINGQALNVDGGELLA